MRLAGGVSSPGRARPPEYPLSKSANYINGTVRAVANGLPVIGAFNNRIEAAMEASMAPVINPFLAPENRLSEPSLRGRYEHGLRQQNDIDSRFAEKYPVTSWLANVAGGMAAPPILGSTALGSRLLGLTNGPLPEMMLRGALTRAGIWGMDAAARGNTDKSLFWPMVLGALGPVRTRSLQALNMSRILHQLP